MENHESTTANKMRAIEDFTNHSEGIKKVQNTNYLIKGELINGQPTKLIFYMKLLNYK